MLPWLLLVCLVLVGLVGHESGSSAPWQTQPTGVDGLGSVPAVVGDPVASLALDLAEHLARPASPGRPPAAPLHDEPPQGLSKLALDDGQGSEPFAAAPRSRQPLTTVSHASPALSSPFVSASPRHADRPPTASSDPSRA